MSGIQYDAMPDRAFSEKDYGGHGLTVAEEQYAEVRGAVERLRNQIASSEDAAHALGDKVSPVARLNEPQQPGADTLKPPSSGVELADTLSVLADRVQALDGYLRNLDSRIAL